ncbi:hypothetical protein PSHT_05730 [Puccinia striiformis]|uniref:Uncharacterized protein n=1 Tax=Puccinia striiformis TaxID=27350 RepID=A0A2S4W9Q3_9BASI|nr:hypothetical protein PSHT_05730 [Puccinia striiformis]
MLEYRECDSAELVVAANPKSDGDKPGKVLIFKQVVKVKLLLAHPNEAKNNSHKPSSLLNCHPHQPDVNNKFIVFIRDLAQAGKSSELSLGGEATNQKQRPMPSRGKNLTLRFDQKCCQGNNVIVACKTGSPVLIGVAGPSKTKLKSPSSPANAKHCLPGQVWLSSPTHQGMFTTYQIGCLQHIKFFTPSHALAIVKHTKRV